MYTARLHTVNDIIAFSSHIFFIPEDCIPRNEVLPTTWAGQIKVEQLLLTWVLGVTLPPGMFRSQGHQPLPHAILVEYVTAFTIGGPAYSVVYFILR